MKRVFKYALVGLVITTMLASTASVFAASDQKIKNVPPGQARKQAVMLNQEASSELPPGLQGKGTPPGLAKRGLTLPHGMVNKDTSALPKGIQMRFVSTIDWLRQMYPELFIDVEIDPEEETEVDDSNLEEDSSDNSDDAENETEQE